MNETVTTSTLATTEMMNESYNAVAHPGIHFRSDLLENVSKRYMAFHGYLSLTVCLFGIFTNVINITVLTRKHMQTPINLILTWMAVSDILTMSSYVPFAIHFYCMYPPHEISEEKNSHAWMSFLLFHINLTATTHTISIWLGVALAIFRYVHLQSPAKGSLTRIRRIIRARIVVFLIYALSVFLLIPNYASNKLIPLAENSSIYILDDFRLGTSHVKPVVLINLFLYSSVAKLLPCILMIVYCGLLLRTLNSTLRVKRRKLSRGSSSSSGKAYDTSKTTIMLLVVIVLFVFTELPQAILIVCSIILEGFFEYVYIPLGDAMDIIALVNNAVNFILYCTMSGEFRRTLMELMCTINPKPQRTETIAVPIDGSHTTYISLR